MSKGGKYFIPREREIMLTPCYWNSLSHTSKRVKALYGDVLFREVNIFHKGAFRTAILGQEWQRVSHHIASNLYADNAYFQKIKKTVEKRKAETLKYIKILRSSDISKLTLKRLIKTAKKIKAVWLSYDVASVPAWLMGGDEFRALLAREFKISEQDFDLLATPSEPTYASQLEMAVLKAKIVAARGGNVGAEANKLAIRYGWLPFGYDGLIYWDDAYFKKILTKKNPRLDRLEAKIHRMEALTGREAERRIAMLKKYQLTKRQRELLEVMHCLTLWTDERKMLEFQLHYFYSSVLQRLAQIKGVKYEQLKYLFTEELDELESNLSVVAKRADQRINELFAYEVDSSGSIRFITGRRLEKLINDIESKNDQKPLKGIVASKGIQEKYTGIVKLVRNQSEGKKVGKNDFLVTAMTTPDFIAAMKKAKGFITDEGGVTCHAAIVAREMNKPCIIGTRSATKMLKDGDKVEVDMKSGEIKLLK